MTRTGYFSCTTARAVRTGVRTDFSPNSGELTNRATATAIRLSRTAGPAIPQHPMAAEYHAHVGDPKSPLCR